MALAVRDAKQGARAWAAVLCIAFGLFCAATIPVARAGGAFSTDCMALGWPGAPRGFLISSDGSVTNGEAVLSVAASSEGEESNAENIAIANDVNSTPCASWAYRTGNIQWSFSVGVTADSLLADSVLVASVQTIATNEGPSAVRCLVEWKIAGASSGRAYTAFGASDNTPSADSDSLFVGWSEYGGGRAHTAHTFVLEPGAVETLRVVMASQSVPLSVLERGAIVSHHECLRRARVAWQGRLADGMILDLRDPVVEKAFRDASVVMLMCTERQDDEWLPIGGPFQYRDVWLRDGARLIYGLACAGHVELARHLANSLLRFQWPSGLFLSQRGQLDGSGQALWALEQAYLRGPKCAIPPDVLAAAVRSWRWLERQRRETNAHVALVGGMMPPAQPNDNEGVRAQLTGTDAWAIAGYRATASLLRAAKRSAQAESVDVSRRAYIHQFRRLLGTGIVGVPPSWQGCGHDWGNLSCSFPCGVLSPDDPRMATLAARLWARVGGAGLCAYGDVDSLHYYLGSDLAIWALLAGRRESADSVFSAMLLWRTASGGAPELFSKRTREFGTNLPPHATSAAALVGYIRNALICDSDDTLRLTLGARPAWWRGSRVSNAPTRWGNVDLSFNNKGREAVWAWTPVGAWCELTLPPGTVLVDALLPRSAIRKSARAVLMPPFATGARIGVREMHD